MSWICKTLLVCLTFNPVMDYKNNDEFIYQVRACALHLNSMYVESDRVPINIDYFGNTSCASIPLIICSNLKEVVEKKEINCAMVGFGVGFSWAGAAINLGPIDYLEIDYL